MKARSTKKRRKRKLAASGYQNKDQVLYCDDVCTIIAIGPEVSELKMPDGKTRYIPNNWFKKLSV